MYIKDMTNGTVRKYGTDHHDSIRISNDGRTLSYANLQNGDGSRYGGYRFCDEDGKIPEEDEVLMKYGADAYVNIGGFDKKRSYWSWVDKDKKECRCKMCEEIFVIDKPERWKYCPNCGAKMSDYDLLVDLLKNQTKK